MKTDCRSNQKWECLPQLVASLQLPGLHLKMKSVEKMVSDFLLAEPPDLTLYCNALD